MTPSIACLHSAESNIAVFDAACGTLGLEPRALRHEVRPDLLAAAERAGGLTPAIATETLAALRALSADADAVLLTCSSLGPVINAAHAKEAVPMLRVDEALAAAAMRAGGPVVALCTVASTLVSTQALFEAAARSSDTAVGTRLVAGAWDAFKAGAQDRYCAMIAEAADRAFREGARTVALAQASMASAAALCREARPLESPSAGLEAAIAAARARSARRQSRVRTGSPG
jgi:hypothetical protein